MRHFLIKGVRINILFGIVSSCQNSKHTMIRQSHLFLVCNCTAVCDVVIWNLESKSKVIFVFELQGTSLKNIKILLTTVSNDFVAHLLETIFCG